ICHSNAESEQLFRRIKLPNRSLESTWILIAEIAMLRTTSRHHDGVRHKIVLASDQITAHRRDPLQRGSCGRDIHAFGPRFAELLQEFRKCLFSRPQKNHISVNSGLVGEGSHMQHAKTDKNSLRSICLACSAFRWPCVSAV